LEIEEAFSLTGADVFVHITGAEEAVTGG